MQRLLLRCPSPKLSDLIQPGTERLLLRQWRATDRAPFAALHADAKVMRNFPAPLTCAQSDAFAERCQRGIEDHGWAFRVGFERLGLDDIVSFTAAINLRSRALMERLGMRHVDGFDHPLLPPGHALLRHRRYRITAAEFRDAGEHS